jgi:hypothetical protein
VDVPFLPLKFDSKNNFPRKETPLESIFFEKQIALNDKRRKKSNSVPRGVKKLVIRHESTILLLLRNAHSSLGTKMHFGRMKNWVQFDYTEFGLFEFNCFYSKLGNLDHLLIWMFYIHQIRIKKYCFILYILLTDVDHSIVTISDKQVRTIFISISFVRKCLYG